MPDVRLKCTSTRQSRHRFAGPWKLARRQPTSTRRRPSASKSPCAAGLPGPPTPGFWRQDFPIDWPLQESLRRSPGLHEVPRATSAAFALGPMGSESENCVWPGQAGNSQNAARRGRRRCGREARHRLHLPRPMPAGATNNSEFVALSQACTHLSCAVIPRPAEGIFYCPCHKGRFDLRSGRPIAGPPRRPLSADSVSRSPRA